MRRRMQVCLQRNGGYTQETEISRVIGNKNILCFSIKYSNEDLRFYYYLRLDGFEYEYL